MVNFAKIKGDLAVLKEDKEEYNSRIEHLEMKLKVSI